MENLTSCPVCGHHAFKPFLQVKDHFLTNQLFHIEVCDQCGFKLTNPRPDGSEIGMYYESPNYISHDAGKGSLFERVYKAVRNWQLDKKVALIKKHSHGTSILDIGCATGEFLHQCKKAGYQTTGIEPSVKARSFAKQNYALDVFEEDALNQFPENHFDVVTMWHVLEHVLDLNQRLAQIRRVLKPGGLFVVAVPNCESFDALYYGEFWAAYDVPRHLYHFTQETMNLLVTKKGFSITSTLPMKLDAFYVSLLSENYQFGRKRYPQAIRNGLRSNRFAAKHKLNYSSLIYLCK